MAGEAGAAVAAGDQHLDRDAVADVDAPALGGAVADPLDDAERLVARDERPLGGEDPRILLGIASADAARFDPQEAAVVVDVGDR